MLSLGQMKSLSGMVTTLNWVGARASEQIERNLGYGAGRLRRGYWIALLKQPLSAADFEFEGTTLRSGGRAGLPAATTAADRARPRVHDQILAERGERGYEELQNWALRSAKIFGPERIVKVIPVTSHVEDMPPADQYPMGGGGLQWRIKADRACPFLIAAFVDESRTATTPTFFVSLAEGPGVYDNRAKLRRYLEAA